MKPAVSFLSIFLLMIFSYPQSYPSFKYAREEPSCLAGVLMERLRLWVRNGKGEPENVLFRLDQ